MFESYLSDQQCSAVERFFVYPSRLEEHAEIIAASVPLKLNSRSRRKRFTISDASSAAATTQLTSYTTIELQDADVANVASGLTAEMSD